MSTDLPKSSELVIKKRPANFTMGKDDKKKTRIPAYPKTKHAPLSETESFPRKKGARTRQTSASSQEDQNEVQLNQTTVISE